MTWARSNTQANRTIAATNHHWHKALHARRHARSTKCGSMHAACGRRHAVFSFAVNLWGVHCHGMVFCKCGTPCSRFLLPIKL